MPDKHQVSGKKIINDYPQVWQSHQEFVAACAQAGPLDARIRRLVGLALSAGDGSEGGVQFHVRRALDEGISADELRHVAMIAASNLGYGNAVTILSWIDDLVD